MPAYPLLQSQSLVSALYVEESKSQLARHIC